tara:strand:+ start:139 stop:576 length:438 start_codon:yes stop_codon:yes gene_type:complete
METETNIETTIKVTLESDEEGVLVRSPIGREHFYWDEIFSNLTFHVTNSDHTMSLNGPTVKGIKSQCHYETITHQYFVGNANIFRGEYGRNNHDALATNLDGEGFCASVDPMEISVNQTGIQVTIYRDGMIKAMANMTVNELVNI